ncbi:hypothetical protein GCM10023116_15420 [Kistimonas scapharcae]|uniref:Uncharacterized protein n=1 Tax=Kistimonas scapharcae TaxID=1036133 RepID=A0ABP8V1G0_9GAMM
MFGEFESYIAFLIIIIGFSWAHLFVGSDKTEPADSAVRKPMAKKTTPEVKRVSESDSDFVPASDLRITYEPAHPMGIADWSIYDAPTYLRKPTFKA